MQQPEHILQEVGLHCPGPEMEIRGNLGFQQSFPLKHPHPRAKGSGNTLQDN